MMMRTLCRDLADWVCYSCLMQLLLLPRYHIPSRMQWSHRMHMNGWKHVNMNLMHSPNMMYGLWSIVLQIERQSKIDGSLQGKQMEAFVHGLWQKGSPN